MVDSDFWFSVLYGNIKMEVVKNKHIQIMCFCSFQHNTIFNRLVFCLMFHTSANLCKFLVLFQLQLIWHTLSVNLHVSRVNPPLCYILYIRHTVVYYTKIRVSWLVIPVTVNIVLLVELSHKNRGEVAREPKSLFFPSFP